MTDPGQITAAAAGTWTLGDLTVNRMGFGAMRLPQTGQALAAAAASRSAASAPKCSASEVMAGITRRFTTSR